MEDLIYLFQLKSSQSLVQTFPSILISRNPWRFWDIPTKLFNKFKNGVRHTRSEIRSLHEMEFVILKPSDVPRYL